MAIGLQGCKGKKDSDDGKAPAAAGEVKKDEAHKDEAKLTAEAIERNGVKVDVVGKHVLRETVVAPARVSFNMGAVAHVGSPLRGRVVELAARPGVEVAKGDVLLVVESPELGEAQSDFVLKRAVAASGEPAVELAEKALERARKLNQESQGISLTEVQKREAELRAAQANVQAGRAGARAAEDRLRLLGMDSAGIEALAKGGDVVPRFSVRAPIAGQVIECEPTLGELISPDKEAPIVIANLSTLWVLADVPEARISSVAKGAKARVMLGMEGGEAREGVVTHISPSLDAATRTGQVRIEVQGGSPTLKPGMFARAEIETAGASAPEPVLSIPDAAVQTIDGETVVFVPVAGAEGTFAKHAVRVGKPIGGMVQVFAGLKEGERVVVSGSFILKAELGKSDIEGD